MENEPSYKIFFIGDSVATIDFGNVIDEEINKKVIRLFSQLRRQPFEGMIEAIPAYGSVTVYYDFLLLRKKISPQKRVYEWVANELNKRTRTEIENAEPPINVMRIPVCYDEEFGIDLKYISQKRNISREEVIAIHVSNRYRVYMLGFLPGFAYLGQVDDRIAIARKSQPEQIVAGSVGIAGRQTGIYPLNSPGGWQIIGRTPLKMFDRHSNELCLLQPGYYVEFFSISRNEFESY